MRTRHLALLAVMPPALAACAPAVQPRTLPPPHTVTAPQTVVTVPAGERLTPLPDVDSGRIAPLDVAEGEATYYASRFEGRRTASGIVFSNGEAWAAHRTYPFGTVLRVTNLRNERSAIVTVVDRGPFGTSDRARRTIIDVSQSVALELDFMREGRVPVLVEVLEWGEGR